jgi:hypothetical protein
MNGQGDGYVRLLNTATHYRHPKLGKPQLQRLDSNEAATALKQFMTSANVDYQLVPPNANRRNVAERAIRTFQIHFTACLCSTDKDFPLNLWDRLLQQALLTLRSATWRLLLQRTPLVPPGTKILGHEKPSPLAALGLPMQSQVSTFWSGHRPLPVSICCSSPRQEHWRYRC